MFTLTFSTDNAAFCPIDTDDYATEALLVESAEVLHRVSKLLRNGMTKGAIFDSNGNRIGGFEVTK